MLDELAGWEDDPTRMELLKKLVGRRLWAIAVIGLAASSFCDSGKAAAEFAEPAQGVSAGLGEIEKATAAVAAGKLLGLDEQGAIELLGPPTSTESRPPSQVWHYKGPKCELDLVFYMQVQTGRMRSLHYDLKDADTPAKRRDCLAAMTQSNSKMGRSEKPAEEIVATAPADRKDIAPGARTKPRASGHVMHLRRSKMARRFRRRYEYPVGNAGWGFTPSYSSSASAVAGSGWGGGRFGPAPYSASGPQ